MPRFSLKEMKVVLERDASELQRLNVALQESQRRLQEAQRMARIGHWDLDLATMEFVWSEEILRIRSPPEPRNQAGRSDAHDSSRGSGERCQRHYAEALAGLRPYDIEYRIKAPGWRGPLGATAACGGA